MKNLFFVLLLFPIITLSQSERPVRFDEKSAEVIFLRKVEQAVRAHDADQLMQYMEPDYKRTQHDEFLEGRTLQFLTEFFCQEIPFDHITKANLVNYVPSKIKAGRYDVTFLISDGKQKCTCVFFMLKDPKTKVLSIYNAVG